MTVTDADRQAAADLATIMMGNCHSFTAELKTAERHFMLTAFARHRIAARDAALEEAAKVADDHRVRAWDIAEMQGQNALVGSGRNHAGREIASEIRALKGPSNG